jgi:hypothetical protein
VLKDSVKDAIAFVSDAPFTFEALAAKIGFYDANAFMAMSAKDGKLSHDTSTDCFSYHPDGGQDPSWMVGPSFLNEIDEDPEFIEGRYVLLPEEVLTNWKRNSSLMLDRDDLLVFACYDDENKFKAPIIRVLTNDSDLDPIYDQFPGIYLGSGEDVEGEYHFTLVAEDGDGNILGAGHFNRYLMEKMEGDQRVLCSELEVEDASVIEGPRAKFIAANLVAAALLLWDYDIMGLAVQAKMHGETPIIRYNGSCDITTDPKVSSMFYGQIDWLKDEGFALTDELEGVLVHENAERFNLRR